MDVRITRLRDDIPLPEYKTEGAVAFDLAPCEPVIVPPKANVFASTGLIIATPPGYALIIAPRSSLFKKKGLRIGNTIGIIDQDFCGPEDELLLSFWNPGDEPVKIEAGERVAQGLFVKIERANWNEGPAEGASRGGWGTTGS